MGQAWARQLANEGATVAILDVNSEGMADTASGFDSVHRFEIDITDSAAVSAVFQRYRSLLRSGRAGNQCRGYHAIWASR